MSIHRLFFEAWVISFEDYRKENNPEFSKEVDSMFYNIAEKEMLGAPPGFTKEATIVGLTTMVEGKTSIEMTQEKKERIVEIISKIRSL